MIRLLRSAQHLKEKVMIVTEMPFYHERANCKICHHRRATLRIGGRITNTKVCARCAQELQEDLLQVLRAEKVKEINKEFEHLRKEIAALRKFASRRGANGGRRTRMERSSSKGKK